jgi:ribosomal-protein-alanine N-acetyltransferase
MDFWNHTEEVIRTERLDLHHISARELVTLFEEPENLSIYEEKPFANPYRMLMDDSGPLAWRVPQVKQDQSLNRWFVRWIVLRESGEIIGSTSFHGAPDENGMVEIGLGIHENFCNKGIAREALRGMWNWVLTDPAVKVLRYTVSVDNIPSIRVIEHFGFELKGQQQDEIDGPEDIYEMTREDFLAH